MHKSVLFPGTTFQVKYSRTGLRKGDTRTINGREVDIRDTWRWSFRVSNAAYKADWYALFGEREGLVYPFLLSYSEWIERSCKTGKQRFLAIAAQEYSKCGRYASARKRNRSWEHYIDEWSKLLVRLNAD